jgi:hypothetical protein
MTFGEDIQAALASIGGDKDRALDANLDPGAACRALDAAASLVLRAAPPLAGESETHGPRPAAPLWVRVTRGSNEVRTVALRGGEAVTRTAARVALVEREESCCDSPGCDRARNYAEIWLELKPISTPGHDGAASGPKPRAAFGSASAPEKLLCFEQRTLDGEPAAAIAIAGRFARMLGVTAERAGEPLASEGAAPDPAGEDLAAADLARLALRSEGERMILRDLDNPGPRASAARNAWIGVALMLVAALGWTSLVRSLGEGGSQGAAIASGIVGALFSLAGYAFLGVARFSARYHASSAPLVAVGRDRIIVLPWVSRDGAVDVRPEGRLGAAIPLHEVRAAHAKPREEGVAVEIDTDHGPIDAVVCASARAAELWAQALTRTIDEARHPQKGATARQRARQRAAATA